MTKPADLRDHQLTVRIPSSLRKELDRIAERERRSVADLVNFALADLVMRTTSRESPSLVKIYEHPLVKTPTHRKGGK